MLKSFFFLIVCLLLFKGGFAQKKDTIVYYLNNSGRSVESKDKADYFVIILPPGVNDDQNLFTVKEYYKNGRIRAIGTSKTNDLNLQFEGSQITFFPNGHKMRIASFKKGEPTGDVIEYYPNGKLYHIKTYNRDKKVFLKQFNDSTGTILAENGKGSWKEFNESFSEIKTEGTIDNGVEDGNWRGKLNDSVGFESVFKKGKAISTAKIYKYTDSAAVVKVDVVPEFPGGLEAFGRFLSSNIRYPAIARENNTQGRVIVSFVVESDGRLTNVRVARGIGDGCDEESVRVISLSPPWVPARANGRNVRVAYSVPIVFSIDTNIQTKPF